MTVAQTVATVGAVVFLTILIEGVIEYLGTPIPARFKHYVAAAFAILVCIGYQADLPAAFGLTAIHPLVGQVFTGLVIGRGSNYVNDLISRLKVVSAPAQTVDSVPTFHIGEPRAGTGQGTRLP